MTAIVTYTPLKGDITDTITASYKGNDLISKAFYISPQFECVITPDEDSFYVGKENHFAVTLKALGVEGKINISRYDIIDNHDVTVLYGLDQQIPFSFDAYSSPTMDYLSDGISFTVKIVYKGITYIWTSQMYPVIMGKGSYELSVKEGKLEYNTMAHVQVLTESTEIPTGSSVLFESTYGLNAEGKMEDG